MTDSFQSDGAWQYTYLGVVAGYIVRDGKVVPDLCAPILRRWIRPDGQMPDRVVGRSVRVVE